jgi:hypothetical protein
VVLHSQLCLRASGFPEEYARQRLVAKSISAIRYEQDSDPED